MFDSGVGKSLLINALLDEIILPSSCMGSACTSAAIEIAFHNDKSCIIVMVSLLLLGTIPTGPKWNQFFYKRIVFCKKQYNESYFRMNTQLTKQYKPDQPSAAPELTPVNALVFFDFL